jgi:C-terminal domain on Strawberry notch homologue
MLCVLLDSQNRLQGLPIARQNLMFQYFSLRLEAIVLEAKAANTHDAGIADLRASSVTLSKDPEVRLL